MWKIKLQKAYEKIVNSKKLYISTIFILFYFFIVFGIDRFWVGFHNVDVCHNEGMIALEQNIEIIEITLDGEIWTLQDCYLSGLGDIRQGFFNSIFAVFFIGLFFTYIALWDDKKK